jgi:large subunit ribosomal protein L22
MDEKPVAIARGNDLRISFKQAVNVAKAVKGKNLSYAVRLLTDVTNLKRAIPFVRYKRDVSHKPGIAAGRYPIKASNEILTVIKNAIANAESRHMDAEKLYISRFECNRPISKEISRRRRMGRLTGVIVELREREEKKPEAKVEKKPEPKAEKKPDVKPKPKVVKKPKVAKND